MVDHFCATYGFLKHFDTKIIYIIIIIIIITYMMHMSQFVFCQTQISMSHISAYKNDFHLSISVENKKSLRVNRQACKHNAAALTLCAFNNSKSI